MTPRTLHAIYRMLEAMPTYEAYRRRHGIASANILSVRTEHAADAILERLAPKIEGRTVVEIGAGCGLLGVRMGAIAKRVFCIEANPVWGTAFVLDLLRDKPANVSFLLGAADEFAGAIHGDVALFCAHIGVASLASIAARFAPVVIDVYGDLFGRDAQAAEHALASLRAVGVA